MISACSHAKDPGWALKGAAKMVEAISFLGASLLAPSNVENLARRRHREYCIGYYWGCEPGLEWIDWLMYPLLGARMLGQRMPWPAQGERGVLKAVGQRLKA
jgi:hypothetical protein